MPNDPKLAQQRIEPDWMADIRAAMARIDAQRPSLNPEKFLPFPRENTLRLCDRTASRSGRADQSGSPAE